MTTLNAAALALLTAFCTLSVQVLVHGMVSAKLLNNYAFVVISLTMLGFALSGVVLTRLQRSFFDNFADAMSWCAALFTVGTIGVSALFYRAGFGGELAATRPAFMLATFRWLPLALLYALPFACCGLMLGALLAAPKVSARRVYFFDLVGSALGALLVLPAISGLGVERATALACATLLVGAAIVLPPKRPLTRGAVAFALALDALTGIYPDRVLELRYPAGTMLSATQIPGAYERVEHVAWDPLARIELSRIRPPNPERTFYPSLTGNDPAFLSRFRKMFSQNNYAFTYAVDYDGTKSSIEGIQQTIYSAAYHATSAPSPRVFIIGVGGGFDVLNALYFDAADVTAVEINAATVGMLTRTARDYFQKWVEDPRVHLVNGEGRHTLAATDARFDVLQLSGVDSYAGTPGAAHVFSENYLYTSEAFDLYLSRLTDAGIINMMRLEFIPPREMLRALTTAVAALRRTGVERPADHVVMLTATNAHFTAMLVKKVPFSEPELRRIEEWASKSPYFGVSAAPSLNHRRANAYQAFLSLGDSVREDEFIATYPFDIAPVDDNRPFFFRYSFWWHLFPEDGFVWESIPVMEYSVLILLGLVGFAAIFCIQVPLRILAKAGLATPHGFRTAVFFGGAGVGYLAIEVALLQKFGHFLGHPNYALSVVLASLLFASGLGSLWSSTIVKALGGLRFVSYVLAVLILVEYRWLLPRLTDLVGWSFSVRALLVFSLVAPIGICLGTFVPTALEILKARTPDVVPWAWGINGIFSVLAPVAGAAVSLSWGMNALLLSAIPIYLVVGLALPETER
ncbi:MAG: hypothetical protein HY791_29950 [Deltaproteobacteria bacterium]|nr:hypothetical protein [Deltaproteobacteria bacterium]